MTLCKLSTVSILFLTLFCVPAYGQTSAAQQKELSDRAAQIQKNLGMTRNAAQSGYSSYYQSNLIDFLAAPYYQKMAELSDKQIERVKQLREELREGYKTIYAKYPELRDSKLDYRKRAELNQKMRVEYNALRKKISDAMEEDLVPHQKSLLLKLRFNAVAQSYGFTWAVSNAPFSTALKTTDKQKSELEKIKKETEAAILKANKEMREKAKAKMMKILNPEQRKQIEKFEKDSRQSTYIRL